MRINTTFKSQDVFSVPKNSKNQKVKQSNFLKYPRYKKDVFENNISFKGRINKKKVVKGSEIVLKGTGRLGALGGMLTSLIDPLGGAVVFIEGLILFGVGDLLGWVGKKL